MAYRSPSKPFKLKFCFIGFHKWSDWSPTFAESAESAKIDAIQHRECKHCAAEEFRKVPYNINRALMKALKGSE